MTPSFGILMWLAVLAGGLWWCLYIIRRLPSDVAELAEQFREYRKSRDPEVLAAMRTAEGRRQYQKNCATDFWTTLAVHMLFFWPVTVLVVLFIVGSLQGIMRVIL